MNLFEIMCNWYCRDIKGEKKEFILSAMEGPLYSDDKLYNDLTDMTDEDIKSEVDKLIEGL